MTLSSSSSACGRGLKQVTLERDMSSGHPGTFQGDRDFSRPNNLGLNPSSATYCLCDSDKSLNLSVLHFPHL